MPYDKFFIGPPTKGQQRDVKPWLIMDQAFETLGNAYTWRGTVKKRPGGRVMNQTVTLAEQQLLTRLRIDLGNTPMQNLPANPPVGTSLKIGQMFSVGPDIFTVYQLGAGVVTYSTNPAITCTIDSTVNPNTVTFVGAPAATPIFWYPALPVMKLATYQTAMVSDERLIAFDTRFAYEFAYTTGWDRTPIAAGASTWTGTNSDFYNTENYRGVTADVLLLFVTNNVIADAMRYFNGATSTWTAYGSAATTAYNAAMDFLVTCNVMKQFKSRMLLFDVVENIAAANIRFMNRIWYSEAGDIVSGTAWRRDLNTANFFDIPVQEAIIAVEDLKDRLIIFCENSTWILSDTGNAQDPFILQQINTELGVESTNSIIPFDQDVLGFGNVGIHSCNGINVERIDNNIPDEVFEVSNANAGVERVAGIRDYFIEVVYWSYQATSNNTGSNNVFPNKVLMYNYKNDTYAQLDDSITAYGNWQLTQTLLWQDVQSPWDEFLGRWEDASLQDRFRSVIAGNQQGWTFIVDSEKSTNSIALQITDVAIAGAIITFTVIDHNLPSNSFVLFSNLVSTGTLASTLNNTIHQVNTLTADTFTIQTNTVLTGVYAGGGSLTRISRILIETKEFNFYNQPGKEIALDKVDFYVDNVKDRTAEENFVPAVILVGAQLSSSNRDAQLDAANSGSLIGDYQLELSPYPNVPYELEQIRFWHTVYFNFTGENIQLIFAYTNEMMENTEISLNDFQLNSMIFYTRPTKQLG